MSRNKEPISKASIAEDDEPVHEAESTEDKVGYGRPPVATRFKPGQSGNPRGRPKGSKGLDQVLRQALERRVPDSRRGGRHKVSMLELIVEGLVFAAAKRDPRMVRLLLVLLDRYAPSDAPKVDPEEVRVADREILDEFIASNTAAALGTKKAKP
jgi:Family of unknown function (DUF5681)